MMPNKPTDPDRCHRRPDTVAVLQRDHRRRRRRGAAGLPQCTGPNLHLDTVHFATPTDEHHTPTVGLSIAPDTGTVLADDQARAAPQDATPIAPTEGEKPVEA